MENENLRVQISDHGAELSSIYDKAADREAVWIGDPAFWNRHAPVLFPFVGKVNGGFYTHKGVKYPMGQHGFARDNEFECIENTENKTVHRLVSTEETKKVYPFDFAFTVTQELSGRTLTITWKVENTGDDDMYFSVGGHPAFMIPEQYDIVFNKGLENHTETELEYVLIDPETAGVDVAHPRKLKLQDGRIPYTRTLFDEDALIFDNTQVERVGGESTVIKSHHNVGGLPDYVDFKEIIEPLRNLFKDEVRKAGLELGIPEYLVFRQPFPGPGLGIRIIGEVTAEKVKMVQDADAIWREEIDKAGIAHEIGQYFAALTNMRSVGVMGDERTYDYAIALRAVTTTDFMTAESAEIPWDVIGKTTSRIVNEVKHINRVMYDCTGKPPATIEFE